jgi:hypothetical protein
MNITVNEMMLRIRSEMAQPINEALAEVFRESDGGIAGTEHGGLGEDTGDQELLVSEARHLDGATEDIAEEQHEHDRLQRREEQLLGIAWQCAHVATSLDEAVVKRPSQTAADIAITVTHDADLVRT